MPSLFENKETIKYGDSLFLINQSVIPNTSATAGYLDTNGVCDHIQKAYNVKTSQDPDRDNGSGTWKLEAIDKGSGPLKYGHQFRLVNQYVIPADFSAQTGQTAGYLEANKAGNDLEIRARPDATGDHFDTETWQIVPRDIKDTSTNFVQNGDHVMLRSTIHPSGHPVYLDTNGCPEPETYAVKTTQDSARINGGSATWQIMRKSWS